MQIILIIILISFLLLWAGWHLFEFILDSRQFRHYPDGRFLVNFHTIPARHLFEHTSDIVAIDVRPPSDFEKCHLPNALSAPFQKGELDISKIDQLDRETPILVYCDGGHRSRKAVGAISELGFKSIYHLNRGLISWRLLGGRVEEGDE